MGAPACGIAVSVLLALAVWSPARAATRSCARIDSGHPSKVDPSRVDPAVCLRRAGVPAQAGRADAAATATVLFARAESAVAAGRLDQAGGALDCAAAVLGERGDAAAHYELVRRRGILDYRRERIPEALARFECALELSSAREDRAAMARDLKNVGSALRRLGDFRGALQRLDHSLALQRADGGQALGPVLNNIGDVYRALDDPDTALRYYRQALQAFGADPVEAAHVLEAISVLELDRGDSRAAARLLETALDHYRQAGQRPYQLRIHAGLARLALAEGDIATAERWRGAGLAMADAYGLPVPPTLALESARIDRLAGRQQVAQARLRASIAQLPPNDTDRPALLQELAASLEAEGALPAALATLRQAHADETRLAQARHDRQLGWARSRFDAAEREHRIAALELDNRQRTLLLWCTVATALALLSLLVAFFLRRQQRARVAQAAHQARHDEELARYREQAVALGVDRRLLKALFDDRADAVCVVDADGLVQMANRAACALLAVAEDGVLGADLAERLDPAQREAFHAALVGMEDTATLRLQADRRDDGLPLRLDLVEWERDGGLILVLLAPLAASVPLPVPADDAAARAPAPEEADDSRRAFRRMLVELMLAVVDAWERGAGSGRLELAEKSRIWRVTIDDGRLRARAMERYLSLSKLPQNPRWRDVLRSAYFVLGQCPMDAPVREDLQRRIDAILAYTRRSALV